MGRASVHSGTGDDDGCGAGGACRLSATATIQAAFNTRGSVTQAGSPKSGLPIHMPATASMMAERLPPNRFHGRLSTIVVKSRRSDLLQGTLDMLIMRT